MFVEPLDVFFNAADFGTVATFGGESITVIFDRAFVDVFGVASRTPVARCKESDVPDPVGQTLTIGSVAYTVVGNEPDGLGVTLLKLELP